MSFKKKNTGNVQSLAVYKKSLFLLKEIYNLSRQIPIIDQNNLANVLRKSVVAIVANIGEGNGSFYFAKEHRHLDIALCMVGRVQGLLNLSYILSYINEDNLEQLKSQTKEIERMIRAMLRRIENILSVTQLAREPVNRNPSQHYLDLEIYDKTRLLQLGITNLTRKLPSNEWDNLSDQMIRASASIWENLSQSNKEISSDKIFYDLDNSLASLVEIRSFLDICVQENFITIEEFKKCDEEAKEIQIKLVSYMNRLNYNWKEVN